MHSKAPWTKEEVDSLNGFQNAGLFHPFTCGNGECRQTLVATEQGWVCPDCDYTQVWAHEFMANGRWRDAAGVAQRLFFG